MPEYVAVILLRGIFFATLLDMQLALSAQADIKIQEWKFDGDPAGSFPSGFVAVSLNSDAVQWLVAEDPRASSPPHVLAWLGSQPAATEPQLIFMEGVESANIDLTVRIKAVSIGEGQGGGVVFRADDARSYFVVWLSPQDQLLRLEKILKGQAALLQDLRVDSAAPAKWHTLRVVIQGPVLEAIFDNRQFLSAREDTWQFGTYKKGKVGLWARGGTPIYFDTVRYIDMDNATGSAPFGVEKGSSPRP
jgi:hypothetical protein